ncbi:hypothetical protein H1C71_037377, partial [Ictidomys tridecemlineatus]
AGRAGPRGQRGPSWARHTHNSERKNSEGSSGAEVGGPGRIRERTSGSWGEGSVGGASSLKGSRVSRINRTPCRRALSFCPGASEPPLRLPSVGVAWASPPRLAGLFFESWETPGGMHLPQACHWSEKAAVAQTGLPENLANFGEILLPRARAPAG